MLKPILGAVQGLAKVALIGVVAWQGWKYLSPGGADIDPARDRIAKRAAKQVVEDLRARRGAIRAALLLHFVGDSTDTVTEAVRAAIHYTGVLELKGKSLLDKGRKLVHVRAPSYGSLPEALRQAQGQAVQGVIFGKVSRFESVSGGAAIDLELTLADVASGSEVFRRQYKLDDSGGAAEGDGAAAGAAGRGFFSWVGLILAWVLVVLLLPVFSISFIRTMVTRKSNRANAFTLAVYTLADAVLALLLVGAAAVATWICWVVFLAALGAALAYNARVMAFALELES